MNAQTPAEGILKSHDFGDCKYYKIVCSCGQEYHEHDVCVEADVTGVSVNVDATLKTDYWTETFKVSYDIENEFLQNLHWNIMHLINGTIRKLKLTWELWTTGAITATTTIHMTEQQTINYAETLKSAVQDVQNFTKEKK